MKNKFIGILLALLWCANAVGIGVGLGALTFGLPACKTLPTTLSAQNTDQIILRAEQTAQTARLTFDTFVRLERDNEAALKQLNPAIHTYANYIRLHGLDWITSLRQATVTFKASRTPENQASLNTILATITNAVSQSNKYIAQTRAAHI